MYYECKELFSILGFGVGTIIVSESVSDLEKSDTDSDTMLIAFSVIKRPPLSVFSVGSVVDIFFTTTEPTENTERGGRLMTKTLPPGVIMAVESIIWPFIENAVAPFPTPNSSYQAGRGLFLFMI